MAPNSFGAAGEDPGLYVGAPSGKQMCKGCGGVGGAHGGEVGNRV